MNDPSPLYRDAVWLVVPRNATHFAERCWWTNKPTGDMTREVTIVDPKVEHEFGLGFGWERKTLKDKARIPCTPAWQVNNKAQKLLMRRKVLAQAAPWEGPRRHEYLMQRKVFFASLARSWPLLVGWMLLTYLGVLLRELLIVWLFK